MHKKETTHMYVLREDYEKLKLISGGNELFLKRNAALYVESVISKLMINTGIITLASAVNSEIYAEDKHYEKLEGKIREMEKYDLDDFVEIDGVEIGENIFLFAVMLAEEMDTAVEYVLAAAVSLALG